MKKPTIVDNTIRIPSSQEYLVDIDSFLEGILRGYAINESTIADIAISVTEIVNNAIIHGNKSDLEKEVAVSITKRNSEIEIIIADQGSGFDPSTVKSPITDDNLLREVGRGIFIVKSLMDRVVFNSRGNCGTIVTLSKQLS
ncbi:MAG: ATP-binding protein [candidate division Zixibacteria bacterium]|nr:ATP-binding protein [candidate division Zixibacteria bacterium]